MADPITEAIVQGRLSAIRSALEKDHALLCLTLLKMGKGRWGDVKGFVRGSNGVISDGTFRSRMAEFQSLGLAEPRRIDPLKKYYVITPLGEKVAERVMDFLHGLGGVVESGN